ncbi:putative RING-H2 finger protein ATL21A [Alnus glutinosa]|uniref:putative RING-H2 finger protein ATL21A n=1 Tax=Alnus glutinosa TaxID=3517 RepID=UPI002D791F13|nr:putative RING-H2 finger protein ATL21A [Alnus glutinosa]
MGICLEMTISYFFLFLVFVVGLGGGQNGCDEFPCGSLGPAIRFPFRLNSQPHHCGYPGFNLSCTDRNEMVLQLPIFVKFFVKNIDYKSQVIEVYDPDHCFPRQLHTLNLASPPFRILKQHYQYDFALFNCSSTEKQSDYAISCLSGPGHEVRAFPSYNDDISDLPIASCKKMYNLRSISQGVVFGYDNINLQLKWSGPKCRHCEEKGKGCRLKNNSNESETVCFTKHAKGIINFSSSFSLASSQYWFGYLQ